MIIVIAISGPEANIASCWTAIAHDQSILIANRQVDAALAAVWMLVAVQIGHDLFFQLIFVFWLHNTMDLSALQVDKNIIALGLDGPCLAPIDLLGVIALMILDHNSIA